MKTFLQFTFLLVSLFVFSQAPQGVSYQAVAFDASGNPVSDGNVGVRISILDNAATGTEVYVETHTETTNAQGLFNLNIGQGTPSLGTFSTISWGTNSKFLKVEVDPTGGTNYTITGTNELMSVPYALYAETTNSAGNQSLAASLNNRSSYVVVDTEWDGVDSYPGTVYAFSSITGTWSSQVVNDVVTSDVISANGNFIIVDTQWDGVDSYPGTVYAFSGDTGTWSSQNVDDVVDNDVISANGNFIIVDTEWDGVDSYPGSVYAFSGITGMWSSQTVDDVVENDVMGSNGSFVIVDTEWDGVDSYPGTVYAFSGISGMWSSQSVSDVVDSDVSNSNGNFIIVDTEWDGVDSYPGTIYTFSSITGMWSSQAVQDIVDSDVVTSQGN